MRNVKAIVALGVASVALSACDPAQTVDHLGRRTAETVVKPIVDNSMTEPQAAGVTRCVVSNASAEEVKVLVRDVGVFAGTSTEATVAAILARPETQSCLRAAGVPQPVLQGGL